VFVGFDTQVGGLDAQGRIVGNEAGTAVSGLAEGRADDPVVGNLGVETMLNQEVPLNSVHLDVDAPTFGTGVYFEWRVEHAAGASAEIFERAKSGSRCATDIIQSRLQAVEFFDNGERYDDFASGKRREARRITDENRCVEHDARALSRCSFFFKRG
jgi:hypothetical protein